MPKLPQVSASAPLHGMAPKAKAPQNSNGNCACLCGSGLNHPRSTFLQGHDQRFVGQLATEVVIDGLSNARVQQLRLPTDIDLIGVQERIEVVSTAVTKFLSPALASKFESAAARRWAKVGKGKAQPELLLVDVVDRAVAIAGDLATKPPQSLAQTEEEYAMVPGAPIKVKVGRWQYDATVHGMSQAGKVTAVRYDTAGGKEIVKTEGQFTIV